LKCKFCIIFQKRLGVKPKFSTKSLAAFAPKTVVYVQISC
jgi:hypothetical protein